MRTLLKVVGIGWALWGVIILLQTYSEHRAEWTAVPEMAGYTLLFCFFLFFGPGLTLAAMGAMIRKKPSGPPPLPRRGL
jgi:hypothetical protein